MTRRAFTFLLLLCACTATRPRSGDPFWSAVQGICGQAFEGKMTEGTEASDARMRDARLVMHVRDCTADETRIPFHVDEDRSRTWVLSRQGEGIRLKHQHRHQDGSEDRVSQYGGDAPPPGDSLSIDFPADQFTGSLIPAAATNVWTMAIDPGRTFTYALRRPNRRFRVVFDLTKPVAVPPPAW